MKLLRMIVGLIVSGILTFIGLLIYLLFIPLEKALGSRTSGPVYQVADFINQVGIVVLFFAILFYEWGFRDE